MAAHSRLYRLFDTVEEVQPPYEVARTLSNGKIVAELNYELGAPQGGEMSLEEVQEYIKQNHTEPTEE